MRSKYSNLMELTETLAAAEERYYMAQGAYTSDFDSLDISLSGTKEGTSAFLLNDKDNTWCYIIPLYWIACANTTSLNNGYVVYFKKSSVYYRVNGCFSYGTAEDKYAKLCESMADRPVESGLGCASSSRGGASSCYYVANLK